MRADMHKVIVERPRFGGMYARKGRPSREIDELPTNQGMRRPYGYYGKQLNDHLAPLRRYLRKQIGRPWNKVYADICEQLRAGQPLHDHLRRHAFDLVRLDGPHLNRLPWPGDLYVDRRTGILRVAKSRDRRAR